MGGGVEGCLAESLGIEDDLVELLHGLDVVVGVGESDEEPVLCVDSSQEGHGGLHEVELGLRLKGVLTVPDVLLDHLRGLKIRTWLEAQWWR